MVCPQYVFAIFISANNLLQVRNSQPCWTPNISIRSSSPTNTSLSDGSLNTPTETISSEKEFLLLQKPKDLTVEIHPLPARDGVIVSIQPPSEPRRQIEHVPCDIVLVIDISGSMSAEAPIPTVNPSEKERNGLTVLDLTKHAARTILETLDENDRLGLVTFSTEAQVVQQLLPMTKKNKKAALSKIEGLAVDSMTNLWHGILEGKAAAP
jgi:hypothetical protein